MAKLIRVNECWTCPEADGCIRTYDDCPLSDESTEQQKHERIGYLKGIDALEKALEEKYMGWGIVLTQLYCEAKRLREAPNSAAKAAGEEEG